MLNWASLVVSAGSPAFCVYSVQGGLDVSPGGMRERCLHEMVQRNLPGYAIGGLAGGEDKNEFWRVVAHVSRRRHHRRVVGGGGGWWWCCCMSE